MSPATSAKQTVGRYALHQQIASGGMATVHVGRLMGPVGFARTVAIKRLHSHFANDPEFVAMFMDEAHLAARIRHPNVVSISDVVAERGELLLVMDYIAGESLSKLVRANRKHGRDVDPRIVVKIMTDALAGLHAAHEVRDDDGMPLGVVHRDVSPQNILVGADGVAQLIDFGVAKAAGRIQTTREGQLKGKLGYMAPEQIELGVVDRRTDIYAAAVVLWEALTSERLFSGTEANLMYAVLHSKVEPPSSRRPDLPGELDAVVMRALARDPGARYGTALDLADALEGAIAPASSREVARWVQATCADALRSRGEIVAEVESDSALFADPRVIAATTDAVVVAAERVAATPGGSAAPGSLALDAAPDAVTGALTDEPQTTVFEATEGSAAAADGTSPSNELVSPLQPRGNEGSRQLKLGALIAAAVVLGGVLLALVVHVARSPAETAEPPLSPAAAAATSSAGAMAHDAEGAVVLKAGVEKATDQQAAGDQPATASPSEPSDQAEQPSAAAAAAAAAATATATAAAAAAGAAPTPKPATKAAPRPATTGNALSGAERKEKYGF